ncbi:MAG: U32 family peptidase [Actinomycetota bacterium]|nr:U32 family peptidase [Actinomycetota bacterium]
MKKPEILSPAGNMERLEYALAYGADAVYIGGRDYSLRAKAGNFTVEDIRKAADTVHAVGRKLYVTMNIFARNRDFKDMAAYVRELAEARVDAVIVADPGVMAVIRQAAPKLRIHVSTQANITNTEAARFWGGTGAARVVLARELSATEIAEIARDSGVETEIFVHGAMCIAYSGRCLMSKFLADRDGNRGDCAHSCRWKYHLVEEKRSGRLHEVEQDNRGVHFFNSKDLSLIRHIPEIVKTGVDSIKIEGRMKSTHYVAVITKIYRQAIDRYCADPDAYEVDPEWLEEIEKVSHREYSTGFFLGGRGEEVLDYARYEKTHDFVGLVTGYDDERGLVEVKVRNRLSRDEPVDILSARSLVKDYRIPEMFDLKKHEPVAVSHAGFHVGVPSKGPWPEFAILRRRVQGAPKD